MFLDAAQGPWETAPIGTACGQREPDPAGALPR
jgi:hypothetical protein